MSTNKVVPFKPRFRLRTLARAIYLGVGVLALVCLTATSIGTVSVYLQAKYDGRNLSLYQAMWVNIPGAMVFPVAATMGSLACLLFELRYFGWRRSSIRRLLTLRSASDRTDLFYLLLNLSSAKTAIAFLLSFGAGFWANQWVRTRFGLNLLGHAHPVVALSVLTFVNSFMMYAVHRIMHSKYFWELHKVHHSANTLNLLTPYRNHPLDYTVVMSVNALPMALLGASPGVTLVYVVLNAVYQSMVHTSLDWKTPWLGKVLISSQAHRVHHSVDPNHWNTNFGIFVFWDKLFGTWYDPAKIDPASPLIIGVPEEPLFNRDSHLKDMFSIYWRQLRVWRDAFRQPQALEPKTDSFRETGS